MEGPAAGAVAGQCPADPYRNLCSGGGHPAILPWGERRRRLRDCRTTRLAWFNVTDQLIVRGAREHNLRNVDITLPRDSLVVFTGLSGSGKSSLAFDTIFAEGQRRYVESLSSYARQFLGQMDKPDVDFIEGLSPAVSIDQKSTSRNPRSTVGTITEIYDYLRLLYARIGHPHCPICGEPISKQTPQQIVDRVLEMPEGTRFQVLAPVIRERKGEYVDLLADLQAEGLLPGPDRRRGPSADRGAEAQEAGEALHRGRRRPAGQPGDREAAHHRLGGDRARPRRRRGDPGLRRPGRGRPAARASLLRTAGLPERPPARRWTSWSRGRSPSTPRSAPARNAPGSAPARRSTPSWWCRTGRSRSTAAPSTPGRPAPPASTSSGCCRGWASRWGSPSTPPGTGCPRVVRKAVLHGTDHQVHVTYRNRYGRQRSYYADFEGVIPYLERRAAQTDSDFAREKYEGYMREVPCPVCLGTRLKPEILHVTIRHKELGDKNIADLAAMSIKDAAAFFPGLELSERDRMIAERVLKEVDATARVPARRRAGLPVAGTAGRDPVRRRGAADPAGHPDRVRPGRRAVRAGRAVDRAAPAGQPPADRDPDPAARPGQHADRGRARRGHHPDRRLGRRHRAGRGRARRQGRGLRDGRRPGVVPGVDHRRVPVRCAGDRDPAGAPSGRPAPQARRWSGRASTTCAT